MQWSKISKKIERTYFIDDPVHDSELLAKKNFLSFSINSNPLKIKDSEN